MVLIIPWNSVYEINGRIIVRNLFNDSLISLLHEPIEHYLQTKNDVVFFFFIGTSFLNNPSVDRSFLSLSLSLPHRSRHPVMQIKQTSTNSNTPHQLLSLSLLCIISLHYLRFFSLLCFRIFVVIVIWSAFLFVFSRARFFVFHFEI